MVRDQPTEVREKDVREQPADQQGSACWKGGADLGENLGKTLPVSAPCAYNVSEEEFEIIIGNFQHLQRTCSVSQT
jgi:hypothetical protein